MTLCNMSIEGGARVGYVNPDDTTFAYLKGRPFAPKGEAWDQAVTRWRTLPTDEDAKFDRSLTLDAGELVPMITYGTNPGMGMPITERVPDPDRLSDPSQKLALQKALTAHHDVLEAWWYVAREDFAQLRDGKKMPEVRHELLTSIKDKLIPLDVLDENIRVVVTFLGPSAELAGAVEQCGNARHGKRAKQGELQGLLEPCQRALVIALLVGVYTPVFGVVRRFAGVLSLAQASQLLRRGSGGNRWRHVHVAVRDAHAPWRRLPEGWLRRG